MAQHIAALARPGALVLFWCFYGPRSELPRISFHGPSRMAPGLEPGEEQALFRSTFDIEPFARHPHVACFVLRRKQRSTAPTPTG